MPFSIAATVYIYIYILVDHSSTSTVGFNRLWDIFPKDEELKQNQEYLNLFFNLPSTLST
ncbi:hypothetical protein PP707_01525 [Acetobacter pasteurianus]|nr:hypothetical protein [Acetobacter pasteurianus]